MSNLSVNAIRFLGVDAINQSNSGHPGVVMGAAPMGYTLFTRQMHVNPEVPNWINRDRFVLSPGHGSALLYAMLHLAGYDRGLRVLELAPGVVYTDMTKDARMHIGRTEGVDPGEAAKIAAAFAVSSPLALSPRISP